MCLSLFVLGCGLQLVCPDPHRNLISIIQVSFHSTCCKYIFVIIFSSSDGNVDVKYVFSFCAWSSKNANQSVNDILHLSCQPHVSLVSLTS